MTLSEGRTLWRPAVAAAQSTRRAPNGARPVRIGLQPRWCARAGSGAYTPSRCRSGPARLSRTTNPPQCRQAGTTTAGSSGAVAAVRAGTRGRGELELFLGHRRRPHHRHGLPLHRSDAMGPGPRTTPVRWSSRELHLARSGPVHERDARDRRSSLPLRRRHGRRDVFQKVVRRTLHPLHRRRGLDPSRRRDRRGHRRTEKPPELRSAVASTGSTPAITSATCSIPSAAADRPSATPRRAHRAQTIVRPSTSACALARNCAGIRSTNGLTAKRPTECSDANLVPHGAFDLPFEIGPDHGDGSRMVLSLAVSSAGDHGESHAGRTT